MNDEARSEGDPEKGDRGNSPSSVQPIFIVGRNRSGTTWLGNLLCAHPDVAGAFHPIHEGIHESAYFSDVVNRYGPLEIWSNFVEFVECFGKSDYCHLIGCSKEELYALWPEVSYAGVFASIMQAFAERRGAKAWVEKSPSHTIYLRDLAALYPDAHFIAMRREVTDSVASALVQQSRDYDPRISKLGWRRTWSIIRISLLSGIFERVVDEIQRSEDRLLVVEYDTLRAHTGNELGRILEFLGLAPFAQLPAPSVAPNTSFGTGADRQTHRRTLRSWEIRLSRATYRLGKAIPAAMSVRLRMLWRRTQGRRELPWWFYKSTMMSIPAESRTTRAARGRP